MRALDADHNVLMLLGHLGRKLGIEIVDVLLELIGEDADAGDVEHGEHAGARALDDGAAELGKLAPAGRAGIDHGRHPGPEAEVIRIETRLAAISAAGAVSGEDMSVDVDQAWRHIQTRCVDHLAGFRGGNIRANRCYSARFNCDVADGVDVVLRIDDMAAFQKQVVLLREGGNHAEQQYAEQKGESSHRILEKILQRELHLPVIEPRRSDLAERWRA